MTIIKIAAQFAISLGYWTNLDEIYTVCKENIAIESF